MSAKLTKSYIHVPRETPMLGMTLGEIFNETANRNPDKEMFYADKERKTFRQMQEESQRFAASLLKLGLKKGDVLGVWGGNHYEWLLAYLAAFQIGVITANMRMDFPMNVQQEVIKRLGIKILVLMRSPADICDRASQIIPELLTNSAKNLKCENTPSLKYVVNAGPSQCKGTILFTDFMELGKDVDRSDVLKAMRRVDIDDITTITFTSGSTGFPKGVTHTNRSASLFRDLLKIYEKDAHGNTLQFWTRYALIMSFGGGGAQFGALSPVFTGYTTIIVGPKYDAQMLANVIHDERIYTGVPLGAQRFDLTLRIRQVEGVTRSAMLIHHLNDILTLPNFDEYDFSSYEACMAMGSIILPNLRKRFAKITKHVLLGYGGTEDFMALQSPSDPPEILEGAAYRPCEGSEVKIVGDDGLIVPVGDVGEICFRCLTLFEYYWGEEEKTKAVKKPTGWYHTGDLGTLNEDGCLRIVGRKAERIIKEGINIAPGNLEKMLDAHPAVHNVMVVGVPDERTSEEVCACVRLHPASKVAAEELKEFCKEKVSDFLVPKYIVFMEDAFTTTETGKFDRKKIAAYAKEFLGL